MRKPIERICVIQNPVAGWRSEHEVNKLLQLLESKKTILTITKTECTGHAELLAQEACQEGVDLIVVIGGDGTISEVVNGMIHFQNGERRPMPALAIYPSGTTNLVAMELGISKEPDRFIETLFSGQHRTIWPAKVNDKYFIAVVGVGFDAHIVGGVTSRHKEIFSKLAYLFQTFLLVFHGWNQKYKIQIDQSSYYAASAIIINSRYYGGKYSLIPQASLTSPDIYVCLFQRCRRRDLLSYLLYFLNGKLHKHKDIKIVSGNTVKLEGLGEPKIQIDGDAISDNLPIKISRGNTSLNIIA